jgi:hypothetical protein
MLDKASLRFCLKDSIVNFEEVYYRSLVKEIEKELKIVIDCLENARVCSGHPLQLQEGNGVLVEMDDINAGTDELSNNQLIISLKYAKDAQMKVEQLKKRKEELESAGKKQVDFISASAGQSFYDRFAAKVHENLSGLAYFDEEQKRLVNEIEQISGEIYSFFKDINNKHIDIENR